jgi:hypothetical protein
VSSHSLRQVSVFPTAMFDLSVFALSWPLPPTPPPSPATVMPMPTTVEELQELLLAREGELMRSEEALATWEEMTGISMKALAKVRNKADATQKEYHGKIEAHTTDAKHALGLDRLLGRRKSRSMKESGTWSYERRH